MSAWKCPACDRAVKQRLWYCRCGSDYRPEGKKAPAPGDGGLFSWDSLLLALVSLLALLVGGYYVLFEPYALLPRTEVPLGWLFAALGLPLLFFALTRARVVRGVLLDMAGR